MHNFVGHSNESACRKSGLLGMEQVDNKDLEAIGDSVIQLCVIYHVDC